jgi:nucleotide-binding universal stress UspA family protein
MSRIKSILVPVDFSAASQRALAAARDLATAFGATIHLLHVFETPLAMGAFMDMYTPAPDDYVESLATEACAQLTALLREKEKTDSPVVAARMGMPADEILQYAREHGAIDRMLGRCLRSR